MNTAILEETSPYFAINSLHTSQMKVSPLMILSQILKNEPLKLKIVLEKFGEYCNPRRNITILRHQFFTHKQDEGQSFNDFVTDLKKRASECEFGTLTDSLTKDMIVCGVADHALRERLLRDADLTLAKAIDAGIAAEETKRHTKELEKHQSEVHQVRHQKEKRIKESNKTPDMIKKCKFCNGSHLRGVCPAYGKRCRNCNRRNHFAVCCSQKSIKHVHQQDTSSDDSSVAGNDDVLFKSTTTSALNGLNNDPCF